MTIKDAGERYNIPVEILKEYESWGLCEAVKNVMGVRQYDDNDLERLSMIMTLHDIGFDNNEIESYMRLIIEGRSTEKERLDILNKKRQAAIDEMHFKQKQIDLLDYLRYKIISSNKDSE